MWIIALEALLALSLLILIVWATMGRSKQRDDAPNDPDAIEQRKDERKP